MSDPEKQRTEVEPEPPAEDQPAVPGEPGGTPVSADVAKEGSGARARAASLTAAPASQPGVEDVRAWQGYRVDAIDGNAVAKVEGLFTDAESGEPAWVLLKLGRFGRVVPISIRECAAAAGRIWIPHDRELIREAPAVDPSQPLTGEQEKQVLDYYGIPDTIGRGAEIKDRDPDKVASKPAGPAA